MGIIELIQAIVAAFLVGFSKTGMPGLGIVIVPLLAAIFPAKESVGVLLPMLIFGDLFALAYYRRHAVWKHLVPLLPWVTGGLTAGFFALKNLDNEQMKMTLGTMALVLVVLQIIRARCGGWMEERMPKTWWFAAVMGVLAGFATMLGNMAGSIMSLYLLAKALPKKEFIGTGAWYYVIVNCLKIPFHASLGIITAQSLKFNAWMTPVITVGAFVGLWLLPKIPQKVFEKVILIVAAASALRLLFF